MQQAARREVASSASYVSLGSKAERCCPSHSPTLRPWIVDRRVRCPLRSPSYVEGLWSPSLAHVTEIRRRKQKLNTDAHFILRAEESFSLRRGLDSV